jgi:hypothetical protein
LEWKIKQIKNGDEEERNSMEKSVYSTKRSTN